MLDEKEREALYLLDALPEMYPQRLSDLYRFAGSFQDALGISEKELLERGVFHRRKKNSSYEECRTSRVWKEEQLEKFHSLEAAGIRMIDFTEEDMPERLRSMPEPPPVLFVKGKLPDDRIPSVSIIGARQCSEYGRMAAAFFGRELAAAGIQVISGMAIGIDAAATAGALEGRNRFRDVTAAGAPEGLNRFRGSDGRCLPDRAAETVTADELRREDAAPGVFAVFGSGVSVCYPASEKRLYRQLTGGSGGVLSEFVPDADPLGFHFVIRNRIIAALGDALLVIEAKEKSGTSITVEAALSQGKDIFALPGRITDPLGAGCNRLLKDGAMVLTSPRDVLDYFGIEKSCCPDRPQENIPADLSAAERKALAAFGPESIHLEAAAEKAGIPVAQLIPLLSSLELKGCVQSTGYASYRRLYR